MGKLARLQVDWLECDGDALEAGHVPDVSIIDAVGMSPHEIIEVANQCRASCVVLWGVSRAVAGLPALPMRFSTRALLVHIKAAPGGPTHDDMHQCQYGFTKVFSFATIPLQLNAIVS